MIFIRSVTVGTVKKVEKFLEKQTELMSISRISREIKVNYSSVVNAINFLIDEGKVERVEKVKTQLLYRIKRGEKEE